MNLIACVQIPNIAIAVARRDQPALADQPLILYTAERQRTLVAAASDDTGVAAGMPLRQAIARCPHAVYEAANPVRDGQACAALANRSARALHPRGWGQMQAWISTRGASALSRQSSSCSGLLSRSRVVCASNRRSGPRRRDLSHGARRRFPALAPP